MNLNSKNKGAFTLLELLVIMGIMSALMALGVVGALALQERARDQDRTTILSSIATQVNNYRRANLEYPPTELVQFSDQGLLINNNLVVETNGATTSSNKTSNSSTRYYYEKTQQGYALCAILESGRIQSVGTSECPELSEW